MPWRHSRELRVELFLAMQDHRLVRQSRRRLAGEAHESGHTGDQPGRRPEEDLFTINSRAVVLLCHRPVSAYLFGAENWLMRKMTNSAGRTIATPISVTTCPNSRNSGGLVSASHLT